jgi:hypothetical protein
MDLRVQFGTKSKKIFTPRATHQKSHLVISRMSPENFQLLRSRNINNVAEFGSPKVATQSVGRSVYMTRREDIINFSENCDLPGSIGAELGVATGQFSRRLLENSSMYLFSIDMWEGDRNHDIEQYKQALRALLPYKERSTVLRMRFNEAVDLFPDFYFDFIYVDGYAHTGEEEGQTFSDWYPKLKPGGVFAGDDYHDRWPKVTAAVDEFISRESLKLNMHTFDPDNPWDGYPSWWARKPGA